MQVFKTIPNSILFTLVAASLVGCNPYPTQAYYHGRHVAPNQQGYVSSAYYTSAKTRGYVSSYENETMGNNTNAPYQQQYVSAQRGPEQYIYNDYNQDQRPAMPQGQELYGGQSGPGQDNLALQQWGFFHQRSMGQSNYFIFRNVNHQINLERAIENVTQGDTVSLGQQADGRVIYFTPNSPVYMTTRTNEWCREAFIEVVNAKPLRANFCRQAQQPWALIR